LNSKLSAREVYMYLHAHTSISAYCELENIEHDLRARVAIDKVRILSQD